MQPAAVTEPLPKGRAWRGSLWFAAIVGLLVLLIHAAVAEDAPAEMQQWRVVHKSLFDPVMDGYQIVAVTTQSDPADTYSTKTFYLQKQTAVAKCYETYFTKNKTHRMTGALLRFQLVRPYESKKGE